MKKKDILGLVLLAGVVTCRYWTPAADFYADRCYPLISTALSWPASLVRFSLEEIVVTGFVLSFLGVLFSSIHRKDGFFRWLWRTVRVAIWLIVWLYMGWGNNYFRTPLYDRLEISPTHFETEGFERFLSDYTRELNKVAGSWDGVEQSVLEGEIKEYYAGRAVDCGYAPLREWQHVKKPLLNPMFSAVSVLGWMGPFFCESQVNLDIPEVEYPFTMAHEMAHLAGVTGEGEANYWAYAFCRQSEDRSICYSGLLALLPYVASNARALLSEDRYDAWIGSVSRKAIEDNMAIQEFWDGKRVRIIDRAQHLLMDLFLKSNGISEGAKDYSGVIGIIMTMDGYFGDSPFNPPTPSSAESSASTKDLPRITI